VRPELRGDATAVIAPHGGGIEPGTSELAEAIAGADLSFYAFEGIKTNGNRVLHITSSRFDEPKALALVAASPAVVALHGELDCPDQVVFLGGLDKELGSGFKPHSKPQVLPLEFTTTRICKASTKITFAIFVQSGQGVQLELSQPLRYSFFASFDKRGRERRTPQGDKFVDAVRKAILGGNAGAARKADKSNESQAFGFAAGGTKGSGDGGAGFL
jgi:phage replication-related protein YjqB (UPF0714/DUF867 family)